MKKFNVLIVDDNPDHLTSIEAIVLRNNHTPFRATGYDEAIKILQSGLKIDILITDLKMKNELDGIKLCKYVKKNHPAADRILITSFMEILDTSSIDFSEFSLTMKVAEAAHRLKSLFDERAAKIQLVNRNEE